MAKNLPSPFPIWLPPRATIKPTTRPPRWPNSRACVFFISARRGCRARCVCPSPMRSNLNTCRWW